MIPIRLIGRMMYEEKIEIAVIGGCIVNMSLKNNIVIMSHYGTGKFNCRMKRKVACSRRVNVAQ